jgi:hypothetical protein
MFVSCVCVLCRQRSLRRADHLFRGVIPCVCVCVCVCDIETSTTRRPGSELGSCSTERNLYTVNSILFFPPS